jgi:hypothetical protein
MNYKLQRMKKITTYFALVVFLYSCTGTDPNLKKELENNLDVNQLRKGSVELSYRDTIYIPTYTEIYMEHDTWKLQLTPTISVRNTSLKDTVYIEEIDHYNSQGELVHQYHDNIVFLGPLQSIEYVVAERESESEAMIGGSFIIIWGAKSSKVKPIFQGIMISSHGPQGISFLTEGVSISGETLRE